MESNLKKNGSIMECHIYTFYKFIFTEKQHWDTESIIFHNFISVYVPRYYWTDKLTPRKRYKGSFCQLKFVLNLKIIKILQKYLSKLFIFRRWFTHCCIIFGTGSSTGPISMLIGSLYTEFHESTTILRKRPNLDLLAGGLFGLVPLFP